MLKRLVVLLLSLSIAHLNAVRADAACAGHEASAPAVPSGEHAHHAQHAPAPAPAQDEPCDAPAQQECCAAMASCAIAIDCVGAAMVADDAGSRGDVNAGHLAGPRSAPAAPEPPPPRV